MEEQQCLEGVNGYIAYVIYLSFLFAKFTITIMEKVGRISVEEEIYPKSQGKEPGKIPWTKWQGAIYTEAFPFSFFSNSRNLQILLWRGKTLSAIL